MKALKFAGLLSFMLLLAATKASATWSIIVFDPKTKEIGIAGASCTVSVYGIGSIAPGKGAIVVQAMSNGAARMKGMQMIMADAAPADILKAIMDPYFVPEKQQYAIISAKFPDQPVTYTGESTHDAKGTLTARGISVQGNTLTSEEELQAVMDAALKAQKDSMRIEDVLMLALEAGAKTGGDKRCGEIKASSAFITVAKAADDMKDPFLNIVVTKTEENVNAVEVLRKKFNEWKDDRKK